MRLVECVCEMEIVKIVTFKTYEKLNGISSERYTKYLRSVKIRKWQPFFTSIRIL